MAVKKMKSYYIYETIRYEVQAFSENQAWKKLCEEGEDHSMVIDNWVEYGG